MDGRDRNGEILSYVEFLRTSYFNDYVKYCKKCECNRVNSGGWSLGLLLFHRKNAKYVKYINFLSWSSLDVTSIVHWCR